MTHGCNGGSGTSWTPRACWWCRTTSTYRWSVAPPGERFERSHRGLESIRRALGHRDYARLRFGVGRRKQRRAPVSVLEEFAPRLRRKSPPRGGRGGMLVSQGTMAYESVQSQGPQGGFRVVTKYETVHPRPVVRRERGPTRKPIAFPAGSGSGRRSGRSAEVGQAPSGLRDQQEARRRLHAVRGTARATW